MTDEFDDFGPENNERPAASGSALSGLRARRQKAVEELHLDLPVQRLDPPVYVRFAPVEQPQVEAITKRYAKSKDKDKTVTVNALILAHYCRGVFEVIDGEEVSVDDSDRDGEWPRFDERLAELLGLESTRAVDVVRGLYLTDGDVIATAGKLADWSGYSIEELEERTGN